ncbi:hypothetical protein V3C99_009642 [Haemonchus contortus]
MHIVFCFHLHRGESTFLASKYWIFRPVGARREKFALHYNTEMALVLRLCILLLVAFYVQAQFYYPEYTVTYRPEVIPAIPGQPSIIDWPAVLLYEIEDALTG